MQVNPRKNEYLLSYGSKNNSENTTNQELKNSIFANVENDSQQFKPCSWWERATQKYNDMQKRNQEAEANILKALESYIAKSF